MKNKNQKREEAKYRNAICAQLPLTERIEIIKERRGNSTRELARLERRLPAKSPAKLVAVAVVPPADAGMKSPKAKRAKKADKVKS